MQSMHTHGSAHSLFSWHHPPGLPPALQAPSAAPSPSPAPVKEVTVPQVSFTAHISTFSLSSWNAVAQAAYKAALQAAVSAGWSWQVLAAVVVCDGGDGCMPVRNAVHTCM